MKYFLSLLFIAFSSALIAQVTKVDYALAYDCNENQYSVWLVGVEGEAIEDRDRIAFGCQVSIVVPTGLDVTITSFNNPMTLDNSAKWSEGSRRIAPSVTPEFDYYAFTPSTSPTAFYSEITPGSRQRLFSFTVGLGYNDQVRLFDKDKDPGSASAGMNGADFRQGCSIGGSQQKFNTINDEDPILDCHVKGVDYILHYDCKDSSYHVAMIVNEGAASKASERIIRNHQVSLALPAGSQVSKVVSKAPFLGNINNDSSSPVEWKIADKVISPEATPNYDYYALVASQPLTSRFNTLSEGDTVDLFSIKIGDGYNDQIRLFNNDSDPRSGASGMQGIDFKNYMSIGLTSSNSVFDSSFIGPPILDCMPSNVTNTYNNMTLYPNPVNDVIYLSNVSNGADIEIFSLDGQRKIYASYNNSGIKVDMLKSGIYVLKVKGDVINKFLKL